MSATKVLLVGVGGQGTILAGDVLARVAAAEGLEVKLSEIHGMSQRGGSVSTSVCFGDEVHTMIVGEGCADVIVAFEAVEALRAQQYLRDGGTLFANDEQIVPVSVAIGNASMPEGATVRLEALGARLIDATGIAASVASPKSANVVLLGALSTALDFPEETWREVISKRVPPKSIEANLAAFEAGREAARHS